MQKSFIKREDRKKILLITDDIRVHSGVAQIGREIVFNSAHQYNWVQIAGAVKHPEAGKIVDHSQHLAKVSGVKDASITIYPTNGYGSADMLRALIKREKPDALFLITDPRYFTWLFQIENEIRKQIPIIYLNIWDDYPAPAYNKKYYKSVDALFGISKQTTNINKLVLGNDAENKVIKYVPHGLDNNIFRKINEGNVEYDSFNTFKTRFINPNNKFTLLFNSRNIRRKQIPDAILAWKYFLDQLPKAERETAQFVLHTQPVDQHGTDLLAIVDYLFDDYHGIKFSTNKLESKEMNYLYNMADGVILLSSNEGWGLSLTEALLTGTPIIANVTGGMQDQMCFSNEHGDWFTPDKDIPSNHNGTYQECGPWALPVFPTNRSLQGSVPTPYIWDDRCRPEDAAEQIMKLYKMSSEERSKIGKVGMEWALGDEAGFTSEKMTNRIIEGIEELFDVWTPRESFTFLKDTDYKTEKLKHNLIY